MKKYLNNVLIGFDQFCNTVCKGHPDETLSARIGRAAAEGKKFAQLLAFVLNKIQKDHVQKAVENDAARAATVLYLESKQ